MPRLLPNEPRPPIPDFAGDIDPLNLVIEGALSTSGFMLRVIRNVHLVSTALVLGFSRTILPFTRDRLHRPLPMSRRNQYPFQF